jgi:hypothetical protein
MITIRTLAAALAIAALAVPAAQAAPLDMSHAHNPVAKPATPSEDGPKNYSKNSATGDYVPPSFPAYPTPAGKGDTEAATATSRSKDLRMPDTYDAAHGRGTFNAPDVTIVRVPSPAPASSPSGGGVEWEDVGIGAGGMLAMIALAGSGMVALHRRQRTPAAV